MQYLIKTPEMNIGQFLELIEMIKDKDKKFNVQLTMRRYISAEEYAGYSERRKIMTPSEISSGKYFEDTFVAYDPSISQEIMFSYVYSAHSIHVTIT